MSSIPTGKPSDRVISGSIFGTILSLAIPVTLGMLMEVLLSITDFYWVGHLGATAQDAITSSMVILWTVFSFVSLIAVGVTALVSRHVGASDLETARHYIRQSMWLTWLLSLVITVIGYLMTPWFLDFMQASEATTAMAVPYLRIFFISSAMLFFGETVFAVFRASGDTKTPMKIGIIVVGFNMLLDPLLIFGWGPVPTLGVPGASLATAVSYVLGVALCLWYLRSGKLGYEVPGVFSERPNWLSMRKIARIGLPITSQNIAFVVVYWFLIRFVHEFGEAAGAAMGIGNRMESVSYLTCYGFSLAASTMVGQNLGAKQPGRASRCAWGSVGLGVGVTLVMSAVFIGLPHTLASVFTDNPEVRQIAADYLIILGISQSAMAIEIILEGAFSGAGDTLPPMIVAIPGAAARIPLAWFLAFELEWGINGVWWTLTITSLIKSIVLILWFSRGNWKRKML
ncbi:MATE family efflux transporter [candidate division GN15 bacterium]|nr:MATE family efflux transporter [candidate division GN15 bacterium]